MRERRSRDQIILEILGICAEGENVTRIVYRANTNFTTIRSYLDTMIRNGLVECLPGPTKIFKTTSKGMAMKDRLKKLLEELDGLK
jgi:predicted transcriptional regulator